MLRNKNVFVEPLLKYNYKDKFFFKFNFMDN